MRNWLISVFLFFYATNAAADNKLMNAKFHICTVATGDHINLDKLKHSCERHHMELEVIGKGRPFYCTATKLIYFAEYLETLGDDEIVLFVDAHDVLVVADRDEILEKFFAMEVPFVIAAEKNAYPNWFLDEYPPSPTPFRYINTGTYMGYVGVIKQWINSLQPINPYNCDQHLAVCHYFSHPQEEKFFTLDYHCNLFLPLYGVEDNEVFIDWFRHRIHNKLTNTSACVIHANGYSFNIWHKVFDQLYTE